MDAIVDKIPHLLIMEAQFDVWGVFPSDIWQLILNEYVSLPDLAPLARLNHSFLPIVKSAYQRLKKRRENLDCITVPKIEIRMVDTIMQSMCVLSDGKVALFGRRRPKLVRVDLFAHLMVGNDPLLWDAKTGPLMKSLPPKPEWVLLILDRSVSRVLAEIDGYHDHHTGQEHRFHRIEAMCCISGTSKLVMADSSTVLIVDLSSAPGLPSLVQRYQISPIINRGIGVHCDLLNGCCIVGIAVDVSRGRLYVPDHISYSVCSFSLNDGKLLSRIGSRGRGAGQFLLPSAVALNESNGDLVVSDSVSHSVQVFDVNGRFVRRLSYKNSSFFQPHGLDVDADGNILIADSRHRRIQVFDVNGRFVCNLFPPKSSSAQSFNCPWQVKMLDNGEILVLEATPNDQAIDDSRWRLFVY